MSAGAVATKRHRAVTIGLHALVALIALVAGLSAYCAAKLVPEPPPRVIRDVQIEYEACEG